MRSRVAVPVVLAAPGLVLAVAGLFHPHRLTVETADRWFVLHLAGLVVFPLVGVALAALVRGRADPLAWVVRAAAYTYAVFYTALDVVYGVAAGRVTQQMDDGYTRSADLTAMLDVAVDLGTVGSWALVVAGLALVVDRVVAQSWLAGPALLLPIGAWCVHVDHIFSPYGVVGMLLVGLGTGALARNLPETRWRRDATSRRLSAS